MGRGFVVTYCNAQQCILEYYIPRLSFHGTNCPSHDPAVALITRGYPIILCESICVQSHLRTRLCWLYIKSLMYPKPLSLQVRDQINRECERNTAPFLWHGQDNVPRPFHPSMLPPCGTSQVTIESEADTLSSSSSPDLSASAPASQSPSAGKNFFSSAAYDANRNAKQNPYPRSAGMFLSCTYFCGALLMNTARRSAVNYGV